MKRWIAAAVGLFGLVAYVRRRRQPAPPAVEPADELRAKLAAVEGRAEGRAEAAPERSRPSRSTSPRRMPWATGGRTCTTAPAPRWTSSADGRNTSFTSHTIHSFLGYGGPIALRSPLASSPPLAAVLLLGAAPAHASMPLGDLERHRPHPPGEREGRGAPHLHARRAGRCGTSCSGARSTRARPTRTSRRSRSRPTTRAAGGSTATAATGRRSRTRASRTTGRALAFGVDRVHCAGRELLGGTGVAAVSAAARLRAVPAAAGGSRVQRLALERAAGPAHRLAELHLRRRRGRASSAS